ncbi:MAG: DUF177 domain-containing protein [candidate division Zixibacteria bacterium]|nr:DUF177 domain-containing protein [candidate division Zixibacteria bacterium]
MRLEISKLKQERVDFQFTESTEGLNLRADGVEFDSPLKVEVEVAPSGESFLAWAKIETSVKLECVRCLLIYSYPLQAEFNLLMEKQRPGLLLDAENEDTVVINPQDKFIDISDKVRQAIILSLPLKSLCSPDCKGLCHICGADLNTSPCNCTIEEYDSRWDKLKQTLKKERD